MTDDTTIIAALPVTTSDRLRVSFWNPSADVSYTCFVRSLVRLKDGTLVQSAEQVTVTAPAAEQIVRFPFYGSELLWASIDSGTSSLPDGALFATISLQNGDVDQGANVIQLTSGYVATGKPLNYPLSDPSAANDGPGALVIPTIADPAAGDPIAFNLNATANIEIINLSVDFQADAQAANRTLALTLADTTGTLFTVEGTAAVTANNSTKLIAANWGFLPTAIGNLQYAPIPPHRTTSGAQLLIDVYNIQTGDQLSTTKLWYRSWAIA